MSSLSEKIKVMREMAYASTEHIESTLRDIYNMIDVNEDALKKCYEIDKEGTNKQETLIIKRMLDTVKNVIEYKFPDIQIHEMIDERKVLEFKQNMGVIGVIYNGDIYVTIELIAKAIKTGNAIILNVGVNDNIGTNNLIVKSIKEILEKNNKPAELVEINFSETEELANEDLDKIIVIGNKQKQLKINQMNLNTIKSGYGCGEIYIDDLENENFIQEMLTKIDYDIEIYIRDNLETTIKGNRIRNCEDAIIQINNKGAGYSTAIFSNNAEKQQMFMKRIKSKYVFVNASPTLARKLDIHIEDLYYKKLGMV